METIILPYTFDSKVNSWLKFQYNNMVNFITKIISYMHRTSVMYRLIPNPALIDEGLCAEARFVRRNL